MLKAGRGAATALGTDSEGAMTGAGDEAAWDAVAGVSLPGEGGTATGDGGVAFGCATTVRAAPQFPQKRIPGAFKKPQAGHGEPATPPLSVESGGVGAGVRGMASSVDMKRYATLGPVPLA